MKPSKVADALLVELVRIALAVCSGLYDPQSYEPRHAIVVVLPKAQHLTRRQIGVRHQLNTFGLERYSLLLNRTAPGIARDVSHVILPVACH
jgi:hypothetical protein